jgi:hypothetical protein
MYNLEESSLARLAIPDVVTPEQYYNGVRIRHPATEAIKRLMLAVLEDALCCLQMRANGRRPIDRRDMAEAERWIFEPGREGPFTFESVCETLGIQPDHLRDGIRQWRLQSSSVCNTPVLRRDPVRRSGPRQARLSFSG